MVKNSNYVNNEETNNVLYKTCSKCKVLKPVDNNFSKYKKPLKSGKIKYLSWCKSCFSKHQADYHKKTWGPEKLQFTAYKRTKTVRSFLTYLRGKAVQRGKNCISVDALETLWFCQNGKCALTGWDMTMELGKGVVHTNCSIDRIDSSLGYEPGNVQLVCRAANVAKSNLSENDFLNLCKAVVEISNG
jgi:hypothetical protein